MGNVDAGAEPGDRADRVLTGRGAQSLSPRRMARGAYRHEI